jgi:hypothetical protein
VDEREASKFIGQVWISKSRGLPVKMKKDMEVDGAPKTHISARYEYTMPNRSRVCPAHGALTPQAQATTRN